MRLMKKKFNETNNLIHKHLDLPRDLHVINQY